MRFGDHVVAPTGTSTPSLWLAPPLGGLDALLDEFRLERLNSAHDVRLSNTPEMRMDAVKGDERLLWMR